MENDLWAAVGNPCDDVTALANREMQMSKKHGKQVNFQPDQPNQIEAEIETPEADIVRTLRVVTN